MMKVFNKAKGKTKMDYKCKFQVSGKVLEIEENPRGYYALVEFDEESINEE